MYPQAILTTLSLAAATASYHTPPGPVHSVNQISPKRSPTKHQPSRTIAAPGFGNQACSSSRCLYYDLPPPAAVSPRFKEDEFTMANVLFGLEKFQPLDDSGDADDDLTDTPISHSLPVADPAKAGSGGEGFWTGVLTGYNEGPDHSDSPYFVQQKQPELGFLRSSLTKSSAGKKSLSSNGSTATTAGANTDQDASSVYPSRLDNPAPDHPSHLPLRASHPTPAPPQKTPASAKTSQQRLAISMDFNMLFG